MIKFNRKYCLKLYNDSTGEPDVFESPFSLDFQIKRSASPESPKATFKLYNIGGAKRNGMLFSDPRKQKWKKVVFAAGYGDICPDIYQGKVDAVEVERKNLDFITTIETFVEISDKTENHTNVIYPSKGNTKADIIKFLASFLKNTTGTPIVGKFDEPLPNRKISFYGNVWDRFKDYIGDGTYYIDNGRFFALKKDEIYKVKANVPIVSEQEILFNTFKYIKGNQGEEKIEFEMLFEPGLVALKQTMELDGNVVRAGEGRNYVVDEISHVGGSISASGGSSGSNPYPKDIWRTKVTLSQMEGSLTPISA